METVATRPGTEALDDVFAAYEGRKRDALIPLLQELQERAGYLDRDALVRAGRALGIPASKVYGVASFYNQFRFQKPGRFLVQVCRGTACHVKGSVAVLEALCKELKIAPGQTSRDGLFSLEVVACIGACGLAPVISIGGEFFAGVSPEAVPGILKQFRDRPEV